MANLGLFQKIIDLVSSLISKQMADGIEASVSIPLAEAPKEAAKPATVSAVALPSSYQEIDWSNPKARISSRFTVKDALYLHSWDAMHTPSEDEKKAIFDIAKGVEAAADFVAEKFNIKAFVSVHAWIRPGKANIPGSKWDGNDYNRFIYESQVWKDLTPEEKAKKHVPDSPHKTGHAVDFHIVGLEGPAGCSKVRAVLLSELERLGLRMENLNGGWVHLDNLPVKVSRFFKP